MAGLSLLFESGLLFLSNLLATLGLAGLILLLTKLNVQEIVSAVKDRLTIMLVLLFRLALGEVPDEARRGHLVVLVERAYDAWSFYLRIAVENHLLN